MPKQSKPKVCYLCGQELAGDINDDHVPPRQFFAQELRRTHSPNLLTIPTHKSCNASYQKDEEYFVHTMIPLARDSYSGQPLFRGVLDAYAQGEKRGLGTRVFREFDPHPSGLYLPHGQLVKRYEAARVNRVVWKIVRGLFFHREGKVIPDNTPRNIKVVDPKVRPPSTFERLADRPPIGDYPGVLDYKYAQIPEAHDLHYWALLFWDRIIILVAFHSLGCQCAQCSGSTVVSDVEHAEPEKPANKTLQPPTRA